MTCPLQGKVAIVMGGLRGIGAEVAKELARRGASVALTYVSSAKGAQETVSQIEAEGNSTAIAIQADGSDPTTAAQKIVTETIKKFGKRIDIIVNNAANGSDQFLENVDLDIFNTMFYTNVLFPLLLVKESVAYLSKGGRIVNISSAGARTPMPYSILHSATKAALESVTRTLAAQLGQPNDFHKLMADKVVSNHLAALQANHMRSRSTPSTLGRSRLTCGPKPKSALDAERSIIERTLAAKRIGLVDDIAPIVAFLCDPSARWVTANVTCANGGLIML